MQLLLSSVGDSKTLAIHPWSTTHEQLTDDERLASGVKEDGIHISVGTEHIDDIIADFEQSFALAKAAGIIGADTAELPNLAAEASAADHAAGTADLV